jgi:hypothetical protein
MSAGNWRSNAATEACKVYNLARGEATWLGYRGRVLMHGVEDTRDARIDPGPCLPLRYALLSLSG